MSVIQAMNRLDSRFAWSFFGFLLAAIFGAITIYIEFFRDERPDLRFDVVSSASVLDVREELGKLEIIYDGIDIKRSKQSLRVVVLRIVNEGRSDILNAYYDEKAPLGFAVDPGSIIRTEVTSTSNPYLRDSLSIVSDGSSRATFSPVILESEEWFTLKILVLHPEFDTPAITPIGKVAGVRRLRLTERVGIDERPSFLSSTFSGGLAEQLVRSVSYFGGFIVMMLAVFVPIVSISGRVSKARRRRTVTEFKAQGGGTTEEDSKIYHLFVENDLPFLVSIERALSRTDRLQELMAKAEEAISTLELHQGSGRPGVVMSSTGAPMVEMFDEAHFAQELQRAGFVKKEEAGYVIDTEMRSTLLDFIQFASSKRS